MKPRGKTKITLNVKEWGTGDWDSRLMKATKIEVDRHLSEVNITFDFGKEFEKIALEIAKESLEAFFNEGDLTFLDVVPDGISFRGAGQSRRVLIPWNQIYFGRASTKSIKKAVNEWIFEQESLSDPNDLSL